MNSLSFNTTGMGTQFCLQKGMEKYFLETEFSKHSETFFPLLDEFLKEHQTTLKDIDVFAVCNGPGSFTGIRIGLSVIKMFAYVYQKPCVVVTALEVLAYNNFDKLKVDDLVCSIINAGSQNLYYEVFKKTEDGLEEVTSPRVCNFVQFEKIKEKLDADFVYYDNDEKKYDFLIFQNKKQTFSAHSLFLAVNQKIQNKDFISYKEIKPLYLRVSQAEQMANGEIQIVRGEEKDAPLLAELEKNADRDDIPWNENMIKESFKNSAYKCFIAKQNEELLGYVAVMDLGNEYEILRIVVGKKARFKGVATKLLKHLFEVAKVEEKNSIVLEVNVFNYSALLLYEKLGFCSVGNRKNYYKGKFDACIMRKYLEE